MHGTKLYWILSPSLFNYQSNPYSIYHEYIYPIFELRLRYTSPAETYFIRAIRYVNVIYDFCLFLVL